jgi:MoaA/NifB/PqqE/SkfB family radical SAM enzyme
MVFGKSGTGGTEMIKIAEQILNRAGRGLAEMALGQALGLLGNNPEKNAKYVISVVDYFTRSKKDSIRRDWVRNWLRDGGPGREFLGRILKNTNPAVRRRYIARMVVSFLFREPPYTMLISPTMRCNYRCHGCYAASYERKEDMSPEVFDRVIGEAEDMGINFIILLGGEPFLYPKLFDIIHKHGHSFFQIYTNGSLVDKAMAKKLVRLGNVAPQLSVNGPELYTDSSRGEGAFQRVMTAMDNLREEGCVFGFSSLVTRHNVDVIISEEWIDLLIAKGALYGWLFLYMPGGADPDINLMPTPEQRNQLRIAIWRYRATKPILPLDFWNDGAITGGCIAGGRAFFHVNHRGDVEPCIFCHFATHNIKSCSLNEALDSDFFKAIRENQPFSYNTLRPCPMIDHPHVMWRIIQEQGAKPTHDGAEKIFTTLAPDMEQYAAGVQRIMDDVWDNDNYHDWATRWEVMPSGITPAKFEALRRNYEESRVHKERLNSKPCILARP